jgi:hypothetical protein
MKWWLVPLALLCPLACRDPNSYQPFDPTRPDPPDPPVLIRPASGWMSDVYAYPQNVDFAWQAVPGAQFYELQYHTDSLFPVVHPGKRVYQTSVAESVQGPGAYFWRVRAASSDWNNYTDWSAKSRFVLPWPAPAP